MASFGFCYSEPNLAWVLDLCFARTVKARAERVIIE